MTALPLDAARRGARVMADPVALPSDDNPLQPATAHAAATRRSPSRTLDLSRSRTHDAGLDILNAYKLSGNFHGNLDIVLMDMGVFNMVTYRVEPNPALAFPDCRHVVFMADDHVPGDVFDGIIGSIKARLGFDAPWWGRLLYGSLLRPRRH
jgi:hypothetical protein